eukprot:1145112-Pelagomonas_calceolata.AAC.1
MLAWAALLRTAGMPHTQCPPISDLPARELVPGDIVELHVGDRVPADLRILQLRTATVRAEQASLTGASQLVHGAGLSGRCEAGECMVGWFGGKLHMLNSSTYKPDAA